MVWHPLEQLLEHPAEQLLHVPLQLPVHVDVQASIVQPEAGVAWAIVGICDKTIAPTTGKAAFAAFLKNSLRD